MDLPSLAVVLQAALSPNPAERKAAEESLNKYQYTPQHLVRLLQIIVDGNCDLAVRQVASIHFKNFIAENWSPHDPDEQSKISPSDKDLVRQNILVFVEQVPTLLRAQLGECLKTIIHADYPEQWPGLLHWVTLNLQGQQVFGALFVLRILSRKYEFKSDEERTPVHHVVEETFPHLLNIFSRLVQIGNPSIEVADLIKLICKIYWSSIYLEIPKKLFDPNVFNAWMHLFLNILERPVPLEGQPADPDLRKSWGWWKVKKWTVHILNRLYTRFGDLKLQNPENKAFAQHFQKNYAGKILECHLNLLNAVRVGAYLPDRVTNLILQYLSNSISKAATYTLLQARLDVVLFEIIFPLMCFNDNDQKLWEEDPHEYVRKGYDIIEDLYSPRTAAMDFVSELVRKRGKENLQKFIFFVVEIFKRYEEAPIEIKPYRQKDGALLAIGTLCDKLKQTEPYKSELENMLVQHVFPEFSSPVGHIRAKAAWVAGQYAHINFSDPNNFRKALQSVVAGMRDPELPVRVDSVFALHSFVEACKDLGEIRPILRQLLDEFFKLMNEVENEDLVFTLETIVDKFGEEMAPYAVGLCQNLAAAFWKCMNTAEADDEADDPGDRFLCAFSRISAGGNAAGYYSYKWAEVLSADAGLNDDKAVRETGHRFHETILALGGGKPPLEAFLKTAEAIYKTMQDGAFCDRDNCVDEGETSTTGTSELEQAVGQMTLTGTVLPNDAVSDILTRLSVKELLKMKIVSKSWHALLSDPIFVKSHLKHSILNKEQRLFEWYSFKQYSCQPTGIVRANFIRDKDRPDNVKKIQVVGCVHGLMCISRLDGSNIHIWNPSIKAVTRIPPSHEHSTNDKSSYKTLLRFGFDPKTNDYKVVKLSFLHRFVDNSDAATQNVQAQVYSCVKVQVYSTRKGLWEWTAQPFPSDVTLMFTEDYLLVDGHDGHLHWINYTVGKHSIVAFDLSLERFHEIPLPHTESRHHLKHQFAVLDGKLCEILKRRDAAWDVLVMEEYGEPESWGTRFVIPNCSDWRRLVGFTLRGQLLATAKDDSIVLYDPSTKKTIRSADANSNFLHITEYVESLVWI